VSDDALALIPLSCGSGLLPGVCVPSTRRAASGRVDRNNVAGIRTRHTHASGAAWVAGHAAALLRVATMAPVVVGTVVLACAGASLAPGGSGEVMQVYWAPSWTTAMNGMGIRSTPHSPRESLLIITGPVSQYGRRTECSFLRSGRRHTPATAFGLSYSEMHPLLFAAAIGWRDLRGGLSPQVDPIL